MNSFFMVKKKHIEYETCILNMFYHFKIHKQMTRLTYIRTDLICNKTFVYTKDIQIFEYFKKKLVLEIMKLNSVSFFLKLNISVFKIMMYIINHLSVNLIFYNSMFTLKNFCGQKNQHQALFIDEDINMP